MEVLPGFHNAEDVADCDSAVYCRPPEKKGKKTERVRSSGEEPKLRVSSLTFHKLHPVLGDISRPGKNSDDKCTTPSVTSARHTTIHHCAI
jgi:hypothetical protein